MDSDNKPEQILNPSALGYDCHAADAFLGDETSDTACGCSLQDLCSMDANCIMRAAE